MRLAVALASLWVVSSPFAALAGQVNETTTYFMVRGSTFNELDQAMGMTGPQLRSGGERHAGSTQVTFSGDASYRSAGAGCAVERASYKLNLHQTLPRWNAPTGADERTRILWKTLRDDIATHENHHSAIAKAALKRIENAVRDLPPMPDCRQMAAKVNSVARRIIADHDRQQLAFDASEAQVIDSRLTRELRRNMQRTAGR